MDTERYQVSRKRTLLSWYIDFLLFDVMWILLLYFLNLDSDLPFWLPYLIFVIVRFVIAEYIGSIGNSFLGIDDKSKMVHPNIYDRENWLTILTGVLFILEGSKQLVRWTQMSVPQPAFGFFPNEFTQIIIHISIGVLSVLTGYWFLKINIKGLYLGISVMLLNAVSDALSWDLWDPVVENMVKARREINGLEVRDGEIEFMQYLFPEGMLIAAGLAIIVMLFTFKQFKIREMSDVNN